MGRVETPVLDDSVEETSKMFDVVHYGSIKILEYFFEEIAS